MATASPMPGVILPQFQGDYYSLQNKQALAQALMGGALQNQASQIPTNMPIMPKYSLGAGVAQLGQALLAGKEQNQVSQGFTNLGQQQMAALLGTPAQGSSSAGAPASGMGSGAPTTAAYPIAPGASQGAQQAQGGMLAPGSALNPSGMDPGKAAYLFYSMGPTEYAKNFVAPYAKPTDATLGAIAGGTDVGAANRGSLAHANTILLRPNETAINPINGGTMTAPSAAPAGYQNNVSLTGQNTVTPIAGGPQAVAGSAQAVESGQGNVLPYSGVDAQGNPLPVTSRTAAATGAPIGIRNNNPGNLMPGGSNAQYPDMQTGLTKLDANLQSYGKQGINTLSGVISKWAPPNENDTASYIKDAATRLGIDPNQPIDLANPLQRQAISTVIALHENGPQGVFGSSKAQPQSGQIYASAPLGVQANAEATAKGLVDTMQKSYQSLQSVRSNGPAALQDLTNMAQAAPGALPTTVGPYGSDLAALFSNDAKTFAKSRDHLISTLGAQVGMNTDAGRAFVAGAIPEYGAPKEALQKGLANIRGQVQANMLKADYLSQPYVSGDAKTYNSQENAFDQNITPNIANVIALPPSPARTTQLQQLKSQPGMEGKLVWALKNNLLK